jgi:hypothetical protein
MKSSYKRLGIEAAVDFVIMYLVMYSIIAVGAAFVFIASFVAMRKQTAVGNAQFLRSMIPHHSKWRRSWRDTDRSSGAPV